ncbi:hypothetical protein EIP91_007041 [Steccherinum ochraceum]|uniref:F-box domain-containing protein n=1 Tax=Steccherinum ochraceum TaxID=92696 RepID=A0A4R0R7F2_9APHY|nr:hypothetical protein EIP91_007041 [Steccherinum ochraceum]
MELTDKVIDSLHDDFATLNRCGLVCRSFLRRARYHRFRLVSLNQRSGARFDRLLNASPDIGAHVREMHVSVSTFERPPTWVDNLLPLMAPKMPNLVSVHLQGNGEFRAPSFTALHSVRELYFTHCEVHSMNDFITILGSLSNLQVCVLRDVLIAGDQVLTFNTPKVKKAPKLLEFSSVRLDSVLIADWLIKHNLLGTESLIVVPLQRIAIEGTGRFIQAARASLKYFKIAMVSEKADMSFASDLRATFGISNLQKLESLEFGSPALYAAQYGADDLSFGWVIELMDDVTSPLEKLAFALWAGDEEAVKGDDWIRIPEMIMSKFPHLKSITFHVWGSEAPCKRITEIVKLRLSELDAKGMLHFDAEADPEY